MDQELLMEFAALREYIDRRAKQTETTILTAFEDWSKRLASRQRTQGSALFEFEQRLSNLEGRVDKLQHPELNQ